MSAFNKILVAYDGSTHSEHALDLAIKIAAGSDTVIGLVYAYDKAPAFLGEPDYGILTSKAALKAQELINAVAARLADAGVVVATNVLQGPAADAVLHVAEAEQYDLIVMGSRGLSDWQGALLGSTSHRVLHHAQVPVLIVR
jgi:nucleotide-binding universal stress UspA family protein